MKIKQLVSVSLIAALMFVCLMTLNIKTSTDLLSLGYVFVYISSLLFDNKTAGLGCGLGATLFDVLGGYLHYAPFTFIAYGGAAYFIATFVKNDSTIYKIIFFGILASLIKIGVYFLANLIYYGMPFAVASIPVEIINCVLGMTLGISIALMLRPLKSKLIN